MIDWRALLNAYRVPWRDHGANCTRGNINITCPFCLDDPSQHLAVDESTGKYYCWRDGRHSGGNPVFLLERLLQCRRIEAQGVLDHYDDRVKAAPAPAFVAAAASTIARTQQRFAALAPAWQSDWHLDYLRERGFTNPVFVAKRYELRYAAVGSWAARLLLPLYGAANSIVSWSGRALRSDLQPRYLVEKYDGMPAYLAGDSSGDRLILVEGPLDALKINAALSLRGVTHTTAVALCGTALTSGKALILAKRKPRRIEICLDAEVSLAKVQSAVYNLQQCCRSTTISRRKLPVGVADAAELNEDDAYNWLQTERETRGAGVEIFAF
jgi:hypothetical protein